MNYSRILCISVAGLLMTACSQREPEPTYITPEPVFDKYGNEVGGGGCTGGSTAGAAGGNCLPDGGDYNRTPTPSDGGGGSSGGGSSGRS